MNATKRVREKALNVRCDEGEYELMTKAAEARGLSLSAWVRMTLLDVAKKVKTT